MFLCSGRPCRQFRRSWSAAEVSWTPCMPLRKAPGPVSWRPCRILSARNCLRWAPNSARPRPPPPSGCSSHGTGLRGLRRRRPPPRNAAPRLRGRPRRLLWRGLRASVTSVVLSRPPRRALARLPSLSRLHPPKRRTGFGASNRPAALGAFGARRWLASSILQVRRAVASQPTSQRSLLLGRGEGARRRRQWRHGPRMEKVLGRL
mmetsp:Transcript_142727/g.355775  ORF Transcript_142727/g.355775 Transcript_142727/m.355775 type:complete len:205 (-) Transcript_142727:1220-1834(-)